MNKENAHLFLPLVQALIDGKTIEIYSGGCWGEIEESSFTLLPQRYRIKPEPEFDWDNLWRELTSWMMWVAMDEDGEWYAYDEKPYFKNGFWQVENYFPIPEKHAPPRHPNPESSLMERPFKS